MSTTSKISFHPLCARDIGFLDDPKTLFSVDFRATGERIDKDIPEMFKYENTVAWLFPAVDSTKRHVIVNEKFENTQDSNVTPHLAPRVISSPHISLYERVADAKLEGITHLWVGVPHPAADDFAKKQNLEINYSYSSFLKLNDKLSQKKYLGNMTPKWQEFSSDLELKTAVSSGGNFFLKKRLGAGGYSSFLLSNTSPEIIEKNIAGTEFTDWYIEERADGTPWSVQCVASPDGEIIVFGASEQHMESDTPIYVGAEIRSVSSLPVSYQNQIIDALAASAPLLHGYTGFFGIDFMAKDDSILILEFNVRLTAATIPTLLLNSMSANTTALYAEDVDPQAVDTGLVYAVDDIGKTQDTISFFHSTEGPAGWSVFLQLATANSLSAAMDDATAHDIKKIVARLVSDVVSVSYHNFWPYGWTLSMILTESHCTLSSWHQEKNVLIDVFCCKDFDYDKFSKEISSYFQATVVAVDVKERFLA